MTEVLVVSQVLLWATMTLVLVMTIRTDRHLREPMQEMAALDEADVAELPLGEPAPDFEASSLNGEKRTLGDYRGRGVAFVFVSPQCGQCRDHVPLLEKLAPDAGRADTEIVLVSAAGSEMTGRWLDGIAEKEELDITLPTLVASPFETKFTMLYNPRGFYPYFCLLDAEGAVRARGVVGHDVWLEVARSWEGGGVPLEIA
jgi:thiol-disulfide isomerase/thioredoxin